MDQATGVAEEVRKLVRERAFMVRGDADLPDDRPLGAGGFGLDSIALAELLLDCERRFGTAGSTDLLAVESLTLGDLVAHVRTTAER